MDKTDQENKQQSTPVDVVIKKELENIDSSDSEKSVEDKPTSETTNTDVSEQGIKSSESSPTSTLTPTPLKTDDTETQDTKETSSVTVISGMGEKPKAEEQMQKSEKEPQQVKAAPVDTQNEDLPPVAHQSQSKDNINTPEESSTIHQETMKAEGTDPAAMGVAASQMGRPTHPHRNNRKLAVLMTVMVAFTLTAIAVYVYISTNKNTEGSQNNVTNTQKGLIS